MIQFKIKTRMGKSNIVMFNMRHTVNTANRILCWFSSSLKLCPSCLEVSISYARALFVGFRRAPNFEFLSLSCYLSFIYVSRCASLIHAGTVPVSNPAKRRKKYIFSSATWSLQQSRWKRECIICSEINVNVLKMWLK